MDDFYSQNQAEAPEAQTAQQVVTQELGGSNKRKRGSLMPVFVTVLILAIAASVYCFYYTPKRQYINFEKKYFKQLEKKYAKFGDADIQKVLGAIGSNDDSYSVELKNTKLAQTGLYQYEDLFNLLDGNAEMALAVDAKKKTALLDMKLHEGDSTIFDAKLQEQEDDVYIAIFDNYLKLTNGKLTEQLAKLGIEDAANDLPKLWESSSLNKEKSEKILKKYKDIVIDSVPKEAFSRGKYELVSTGKKTTRLGFELNYEEIKAVLATVLTEMKTDEEVYEIAKGTDITLTFEDYQAAIQAALDAMAEEIEPADIGISNYIFVSKGKVVARNITFYVSDQAVADINFEPTEITIQAAGFTVVFDDIINNIDSKSIDTSATIMLKYMGQSMEIGNVSYTAELDGSNLNSAAILESAIIGVNLEVEEKGTLVDKDTYKSEIFINAVFGEFSVETAWDFVAKKGIDVAISEAAKSALDVETATDEALAEFTAKISEKLTAFAEKIENATSSLSLGNDDDFVYDEYDYNYDDYSDYEW